MRQSGLFRRFYLLTAVIVLVFLVVGFLASRLALRFGAAASPVEMRHFALYAKLVDRIADQETQGDLTSRHERALAEIESWNLFGPSLHLALVDSQGKVLEPAGFELPVPWSEIRRPDRPYELSAIGQRPRRFDLHGVILLKGSPPQYIYAATERPERVGLLFPSVFFWSFGSMVVSVLLGIALSLVLIFRALREKAQLADGVLAEMQRGNLKARFPIKKMDEIGRAMSRFNLMAEEIERLVEQSKDAEKSRMKLLQELAHDLRTPVASQKTLLETLLQGSERMEPGLRREMLSLSLSEVEYFERLIEDLLVLAQVSEPRYRLESERVLINELVREEAESMALAQPADGGASSRIALKDETGAESLVVHGDSHLLRRMIRNAISNAFSFARSEVRVSVASDSGVARIQVDDDGEGFSEATLASFGVRRVTRVLGVDRKSKLSVGLGSVILKTVAEIHGGSARAGNRMNGDRVLGARVEMVLPQVSGDF